MDTPSPANRIVARTRDLGGFTVGRVLPATFRKMVGPCLFFDHMGPARFAPGLGIDVRPHPHIGLATVTFLFEGAILHRDSVGSVQVIRPGDVNWMTAGRGIAHSERTPPEERGAGSELEGIQLWVALPRASEEVEPSFVHHPERTLPEVVIDGVTVKVLIGEAFGVRSPVLSHADLVYLDVRVPAGRSLRVPSGDRELGVYDVAGKVMRVGEPGEDLPVAAGAEAAARFMIVGGLPFGEGREMWWNFVSSSKERIETAKADWAAGRFGKVAGDEGEFIPLPET